jgi:hypothetical protein
MLTTSSTPLLFILLLDFTIFTFQGQDFIQSPDVAFILVSNVSLILNYFFELCLMTASGYYDWQHQVNNQTDILHSHLAIGV